MGVFSAESAGEGGNCGVGAGGEKVRVTGRAGPCQTLKVSNDGGAVGRSERGEAVWDVCFQGIQRVEGLGHDLCATGECGGGG